MPSPSDDHEPLHVLDLPQLYEKPSFVTLQEVLGILTIQPGSFEAKTVVQPDGVAQYLTRIIASPLVWIEYEHERNSIWELASKSLSIYSGRSGIGDFTRTFDIPTSNGAPVSIRVHEPALTGDNLGMKTWSASFVLARRLHLLKLPVQESTEIILELGAGTGLVGLAAARVWHGHQVILTDLPEIELNLAVNVQLNDFHGNVPGETADVLSGVLDWSYPERLQLRYFNTKNLTSNDRIDFDMLHAGEETSSGQEPHSAMIILAADPIYSQHHPQMLARTVFMWLKRHNDARFILAYPLREVYKAEILELELLLRAGRLKVTDEGFEFGFDDWDHEVQHRWSVWAWDEDKSPTE